MKMSIVVKISIFSVRIRLIYLGIVRCQVNKKITVLGLVAHEIRKCVSEQSVLKLFTFLKVGIL